MSAKCCLEYNRDMCFVTGNGLQYVIIFLDENKKPYYKAFITLNQLYVGKNPDVNHITVGMTVQADIHTGEKTLMQYLIKPVYNAIKSSFRER